MALLIPFGCQTLAFDTRNGESYLRKKMQECSLAPRSPEMIQKNKNKNIQLCSRTKLNYAVMMEQLSVCFSYMGDTQLTLYKISYVITRASLTVPTLSIH